MIDNTKELDLQPISDNIKNLAQQVLEESDLDKTKDLVALFNWNMSKKNVARLLKLNNLFDAVSDQMVTRFETKPDQFSNDDLLNYMKAVQSAIDSSSKYLSETEEPPTIVNNTQINVNVIDTMEKDSKDRIAAAVQSILKKISQPQTEEPIEVEFEDKIDEIISETTDN